MGDRRNIVLDFNSYRSSVDYNNIYLYTHWMGAELPGILADALARGRGRWRDPEYLARIIFSEMVKDEIDGETGYGISPYATDSNYSDNEPVVHLESTTVHFDGRVYSFPEYIATYATDAEVRAAAAQGDRR